MEKDPRTVTVSSSKHPTPCLWKSCVEEVNITNNLRKQCAEELSIERGKEGKFILRPKEALLSTML